MFPPWTLLANENLGAITLHFTANFKLKTHVLICTKPVNGTSAEAMKNELVHGMHSWNLNMTSSLALSQIWL